MIDFFTTELYRQMICKNFATLKILSKIKKVADVFSATFCYG